MHNSASTVTMSTRVLKPRACDGTTECGTLGTKSSDKLAGTHRLNSWFSRKRAHANAPMSSPWRPREPNMPAMSPSRRLPPRPNRMAPHLERTAQAKAAQYHTVPWGRCHEDALLIPLVHDASQGWMPSATLRLLHKVAMAAATITAPVAPRAWGAHLARTTHQVAATLTHAACISLWQMHAACGRLL